MSPTLKFCLMMNIPRHIHIYTSKLCEDNRVASYTSLCIIGTVRYSDGWMMDGWMDGWVDGWMDGWLKDGRMDVSWMDR